jgi:predicted dehydrogenase
LQVGLGPHGRNWARRVLPDIKAVDAVAYVDTDPNALDLLREEAKVPGERCFESMKEAIGETRPDAVLVTTALPSHAAVVRASLDAGLHVLVEKPFAPNLEVASELVERAADAGLVLMVSQNYRFFPAPRALAALVREAPLGKLFEVSIDFRRYSTAGANGRGRHHLEEQPLLVDMSIHHFDLLRLILGREPESVFCRAWNPDWTSFTGPSVAVGSIDFGAGIVVSYRGSWVSAAKITPWAGEWRMEFEHGEIYWTNADDNVEHDRVTIRHRGGRARNVPLRPMEWTGPWGTISEFAAAIENGREPETSGRNNLGTIAFMDAMVESAVNQEPVEVMKTRIEQTGDAAAATRV